MADNSGIKLFVHNETAYTSAIKMLNKTGKAAIIHPTGTGKSFIAFKLCEDNINKRICWLSPSEYIFKTQCENLAAVGSAVPDNIAFFTAYYRSHGEDKNIVNEHFEILDEVCDCRELFGRLNTVLTASWNLMYELACRFFELNGNLEIARRYVTPDGYTLGSWINTQRLVRAGKANGKLTDKQIEKLDRIGMRWDGIRDLNWEKNYSAAEKYYAEHGNLLVNVNDNGHGGVKLGRWIAQLRNCRKSGINSSYLTTERIEKLNKIGMVWDVPDYLWERNYQAALKYFKDHGDLNIPSYYRTEEGVRLGEWLLRLKRVYRGDRRGSVKLSEEQINRLNEIGISWNSKFDNARESTYKAVCDYKKKYGNLDIPVAFVTEDGCRLGRWIRHQREKYDTLSLARRKKLDDIGLFKMKGMASRQNYADENLLFGEQI